MIKRELGVLDDHHHHHQEGALTDQAHTTMTIIIEVVEIEEEVS
jgi:hypothetical protein